MSAAAHSPRVAIVTGAADGIGWSCARQLAQDHTHVVLADLRGEAAQARADSLGPSHWGHAVDVADAAQVSVLVAAAIARHGRIDTLVNNAGIGEQSGGTLAQTVEAFDRVLQVHLRGCFLMSQAVGGQMLAQGHGSIVNLGSIVGQAGIPGRNAYGAAKAGIAALTRAMACEWARQGVRVNAVAPGYVRTELVADLERRGSIDGAAIRHRTPLGRMAEPDEIAAAIAFLASPAASFITGVVLPVDGGWLALGAPEHSLPPLTAPPDAAVNCIA